MTVAVATGGPITPAAVRISKGPGLGSRFRAPVMSRTFG